MASGIPFLLLSTGCDPLAPRCDDVAVYNQQVQEAGSVDDQIAAQKLLAEAEADCESKGERPSY